MGLEYVQHTQIHAEKYTWHATEIKHNPAFPQHPQGYVHLVKALPTTQFIKQVGGNMYTHWHIKQGIAL